MTAPARTLPSEGTDDSILWDRYTRAGCSKARTELLSRHLGLVRTISRRLSRRIGGAIEAEDLAGAGTLGLVQALESFDRRRSNSFAAYASYRIQGEILDELRRRDWIPRSVRGKVKRLRRASRALESHLGRHAAPVEMATAMALDLPTFWDWQAKANAVTSVSLDAEPEDHGAPPLRETLAHTEAASPLDTLGRQEDIEAMSRAMAGLPERERQVLALYYFEEMNLREIGRVLGITESRVCQIRTQAIGKLKKELGAGS